MHNVKLFFTEMVNHLHLVIATSVRRLSSVSGCCYIRLGLNQYTMGTMGLVTCYIRLGLNQYTMGTIGLVT